MEGICQRLKQRPLVILPYKLFLWGFYIASYISICYLFVWCCVMFCLFVFPNRLICMVLQGYDRLGLDKHKSADAELCRVVMSKGNLPLDSNEAAGYLLCFCMASPSRPRWTLEKVKRVCMSLPSRCRHNQSDSSDGHGTGVEQMQITPLAPSTIIRDSTLSFKPCLGATGSEVGYVLCLWKDST